MIHCPGNIVSFLSRAQDNKHLDPTDGLWVWEMQGQDYGGGIQKRVSELKSTVISLKPAYFQEEPGMGGFSWPGRLVFLPLVSLRCCICHYDLQAWFSFQFLNPGLSPSMVLINGIHLAKSLLPATCRKT